MQVHGNQLERGSVIGGYRVEELISRGGMGVVYRVTNVALGLIYALKILAPELAEDEGFRERFKRETRIAASISHPNVVPIHYAGVQDGLLFFVMDFISGTDLCEVLHRSGRLEPSRAVELLTQLASALDAAHARGLVHRDVKPANVLITVKHGEEHAYLTDFGVAKRFDTVAGLTAHGAVLGTVDYMSPEQITGTHTDAHTDIYALGCVFFEMLTGKVPYDRKNSVAKLFAHVHEPPPRIEEAMADLYPAFGSVLDKAMAKQPADRYASAGDFARDATEALHGMRYSGPPTSVATGEATPLKLGAAAATVAPAAPQALADAADAAPAPAAPQGLAAAPAPQHDAGRADSGAHAPRPGRSLRRYRWAAPALLLLAGGAVAGLLALSSAGSSSAWGGARFVAAPRPVPANRVTGTGSATVQLRGNAITVSLDTNGLLNGSPHAMHIHAGGRGICPTASAAHLHNGHPSISTTDGIKFYGPPVTALTLRGDTSPRSIVDFSRYPTVGGIRYTRTFTVPQAIANAIRADNAVIIVHGIDFNGNGIYDNVLDRSELNNQLPGEATAPALCGPLSGAQRANAGTSGPSGSTVYTASLHPYVPSGIAGWAGFSLLCHIVDDAAPATLPRRPDQPAGSTSA
jgi:predicted Ser/Thr protein kinase